MRQWLNLYELSILAQGFALLALLSLLGNNPGAEWISPFATGSCAIWLLVYAGTYRRCREKLRQERGLFRRWRMGDTSEEICAEIRETLAEE